LILARELAFSAGGVGGGRSPAASANPTCCYATLIPADWRSTTSPPLKPSCAPRVIARWEAEARLAELARVVERDPKAMLN